MDHDSAILDVRARMRSACDRLLRVIFSVPWSRARESGGTLLRCAIRLGGWMTPIDRSRLTFGQLSLWRSIEHFSPEQLPGATLRQGWPGAGGGSGAGGRGPAR